jgi:hypothetical protein
VTRPGSDIPLTGHEAVADAFPVRLNKHHANVIENCLCEPAADRTCTDYVEAQVSAQSSKAACSLEYSDSALDAATGSSSDRGATPMPYRSLCIPSSIRATARSGCVRKSKPLTRCIHIFLPAYGSLTISVPRVRRSGTGIL